MNRTTSMPRVSPNQPSTCLIVASYSIRSKFFVRPQLRPLAHSLLRMPKAGAQMARKGAFLSDPTPRE
jgi:hypothetical protein